MKVSKIFIDIVLLQRYKSKISELNGHFSTDASWH